MAATNTRLDPNSKTPHFPLATAWLEADAAGLVLLDREGKLVLANETAGNWVRSGGLRIEAGQIALPGHAERQELDRAIQAVLWGRRSYALEVSCSTPCQRLHTVVMQASCDWHFFPQPNPRIAVLLLFIKQPSPASSTPLQGALEPYGLTQAETRVALAAADGTVPSQIATRLHLSRNTIKTHLRRVYEKMGIHRQAELVRVLATRDPAIYCKLSV